MFKKIKYWITWNKKEIRDSVLSIVILPIIPAVLVVGIILDRKKNHGGFRYKMYRTLNSYPRTLFGERWHNIGSTWYCWFIYNPIKHG